MFEWFEAELAQIRTPKFHVVDGPASQELIDAVNSAKVTPPRSYKEFVLRFGNAKLFRNSLSGYGIEVLAGPIQVAHEGHNLVYIGRASSTLAYLDEDLMSGGECSPIFTLVYNQKLKNTGEDFEEWLKSKFVSERRKIKKPQWDLLKRGPEPFTLREQEIVDARQQYAWQVAGFDANGDIQFEVYNGSKTRIPYLSVGIKSTDGKINGGVFLETSAIEPGQRVVISRDCYKKLIPRANVVAFSYPVPKPEDRKFYWEFRTNSSKD